MKAAERDAKIRAMLSKLTETETGRQLIASSLAEAGFELMKQAKFENFPTVSDPERLKNAQTGIILDVETTGMSEAKDDVTELAMLRVKYDAQGLLALDALFDEFNEPKVPISEEITELTGITNDMVAGHKILCAEIAEFIEGAEIVIAHHAHFDRRFVENCFPEAGFQDMKWHCSVEQIDWKARGKSGGSLEVIATSERLVYGSHRADADILALAHLLVSDAERSPFSEMLLNGEAGVLHLLVENSPFSAKRALKDRGYKWCPEDESVYGYHKIWHRPIPSTQEALMDEARFLQREVYNRSVKVPSFLLTEADRYSARPPATKVAFDTSNPLEILRTRSASVEETQEGTQPALL